MLWLSLMLNLSPDLTKAIADELLNDTPEDLVKTPVSVVAFLQDKLNYAQPSNQSIASDLDLSGGAFNFSSGFSSNSTISNPVTYNSTFLVVTANNTPQQHTDEEMYPVADASFSAELEIINYTGSPSNPTNSTTFDFSNVFKLSSNPYAKHTIYLDFDGSITEGTSWNNTANPTIISPAYDTDNNAAVFSIAELKEIVSIWQRVTEDFAPFEVNVTTIAPNIEDLQHTNASDTRWGVRVLMTQNTNLATNAAVFGNIGGIAWMNSFDSWTDTPVFAFNKGDNNAAMTASHEVGHSLGLDHDGQLDSNPNDTVNDAKGYHSGFGSGATSWGAIMGAPFGKELTQWSKGDYQYADNQEDDLAIITTNNGFGYRSDDHANVFASATHLYSEGGTKINAFGIIERNTDVDVFSFSTGAGNISLNVQAASRAYVADAFNNYNQQYLEARGSNLDLWAGIYRADGSLVAESNPVDLTSAAFTNLSLTAGVYYLKVDGVGKTGLTGYSDYGSLGQYSISGTLINDNTILLNKLLVDQVCQLILLLIPMQLLVVFYLIVLP
jgi:hypothetical protein